VDLRAVGFLVDRSLLLAERDRMAQQVAALAEDFEAIMASTDLVSTDDEHDPDGATIGFERALAAFLLEQARRQHDQLNAALERMDAGQYGRCSACGGEILPVRLQALPATVVCVACA
jgi:RNA polymerase-binding transcription factor DksA